MRHDRPAKHQAVIVRTPVGVIYELDVWLSAEEVAVITSGVCMPSPQHLYEPWLRIMVEADEVITRAGIEVMEQDDGA